MSREKLRGNLKVSKYITQKRAVFLHIIFQKINFNKFIRLQKTPFFRSKYKISKTFVRNFWNFITVLESVQETYLRQLKKMREEFDDLL